MAAGPTQTPNHLVSGTFPGVREARAWRRP